jgi:hypothetical protein
MKLYRDMTEAERRASDRTLAFSLFMQKISAEARMAQWDNLTAEERKNFHEDRESFG